MAQSKHFLMFHVMLLMISFKHSAIRMITPRNIQINKDILQLFRLNFNELMFNFLREPS